MQKPVQICSMNGAKRCKIEVIITARYMLSWGVDTFCKSFFKLAKLEVDDIGHDITKEGVQEPSHVTNDAPAAPE